MPRIEILGDLLSALPEYAKMNENNPTLAVNFLGSVLRKNPNALDNIPLRDRYILFSHSDYKKQSTYADLSGIFNLSSSRVRAIYENTLRDVWRDSHPDIDNNYLFDIVLNSVRKIKITTGNKNIKEGFTIKQDPATKITSGIHEQADEITSLPPTIFGVTVREERKKIFINHDDLELWNYAIEQDLSDDLKKHLTEDEFNALNQYFGGNKKPKNLEKLLDRFSLAMAKLA